MAGTMFSPLTADTERGDATVVFRHEAGPRPTSGPYSHNKELQKLFQCGVCISSYENKPGEKLLLD